MSENRYRDAKYHGINRQMRTAVKQEDKQGQYFTEK